MYVKKTKKNAEIIVKNPYRKGFASVVFDNKCQIRDVKFYKKVPKRAREDSSLQGNIISGIVYAYLTIALDNNSATATTGTERR
jgi:hypothetical protein